MHRNQPVNALEHRGLPRSVGSNNADNFAWIDFQIDSLQDIDTLIASIEIVNREKGH